MPHKEWPRRRSDRAREVLALMAEEQSSAGICQPLYLSPTAVETYIRGVVTELGLHGDADHDRRVLAVPAFLNAT